MANDIFKAVKVVAVSEFYSTAAGLAAVRAAVKADYERTDGELNWRQRADLASELAAQKHRVSGKNTTRGGPT